MNLKSVLKTYSLLRQLTDDESALLNTLRAMNDTERGLLVESLQPQKSVGKKTAKKRGSKSARASGMAEQLNKNLSQQRPTNNHKCIYEADGKICLGLQSDAIHDATMGYGGYHEFVLPIQSAAAGD